MRIIYVWHAEQRAELATTLIKMIKNLALAELINQYHLARWRTGRETPSSTVVDCIWRMTKESLFWAKFSQSTRKTANEI